MTANEFLTYRMNIDEQEKWNIFRTNIKRKLEALKLPVIAYNVLDKKMFNLPPHSGVVGYSEISGYFKVTEGDRGHCSVDFVSKSYEDAECQMLKSLARDIGYDCVFKEKNKIELEHRHEWRFYKVQDGFEPGVHGTRRIVSHLEENATWKYDTEYDYRKYWFEMTLGILKDTVSKEVFEEEVMRYETLLNYHFDSPFWKYDMNSMTFEVKIS